MMRYVCFILVAISMTNLIGYAGSDDDGYIRIARISYMEGHVSFQHSSDVDWTAASINLPLQPGDRIYTGPQGRAEIQFDEGSIYRLAEGTDIQFLSLNEDLIQIRILTGLSSLTVSSNTTFEMDTPAAAFIVLRRGVYRFDTRDNGDTDAIVRKGELEAVSHRFVRRIESGEQIFITADENSSYNIARYTRRDSWDEWNDRRDADYIARSSRRHLPDTVYVGVSDLDRHGRWVTVESYGVAWIPYSVGVSWSPYSVGRWCYRPVWGWTWVSYEPWGWLPYHYGRWYRSVRYGWCWLPGPSFSFNFWSPGLVTFYYGPSWVSWGPLGPGDYYSINNYYFNQRLYGGQLGRMRQLNRRAAGYSINRNVRGAFRTMEIEHFRNGGSRAIATREGYRQIDQPWNRGTLVRERLAVQPTSRSFSGDPDRKAIRSRLTNPRPAVVHNTPSARTATRNGYIRINNPEVTSRAVARLRNGDDSRTANASRKSDSGQTRVLRNTQDKNNGTAKARSVGSTVSGNQAGRRISDNQSTDAESNQSNRDSVRGSKSKGTARTLSREAESGNRDRSPKVRSAVPRDSTGTSSGGNSGTRGVRRNETQSSAPVNSIKSTPQKSGSSTGGRVRTNRSTGQPGVSQSSGSENRNNSYSSPSSSSRTRTYSVPSTGNRMPSYSAPSSSSRTRNYSSPSSSGRNPSYSAPSSSRRAPSYSSPSSGSSGSRSYSAPSSGSRAPSYSAPSSGRNSSARSAPSSSSRNSSNSSTRRARAR